MSVFQLFLKMLASGAGNALAEGLVAYWKLDEEDGAAIDSKGDNDLIAVNNPVSAAGQVGNGRRFVASSAKSFRLPSATVSNTIAPHLGDFSISMWVKRNANNFDTLLSWGRQASTNQYIWVYMSGQFVTVQFVDGQNGYNTMSSLGLVNILNDFFHLGLVFDRDGDLSSYVNGTLAGTGDISGQQSDFAPSTGDFRLGDYSDGGAAFDGVLDEVNIWNRALSADEIEADYTTGAAGNPIL